MNKNIYKITTIALLTGVVGLFTQCVSETAKIESIDTSNKVVKSVPKTEGEMLQALEVSSGVKSFEETLLTLSALTGVPETNNAIRTVYADVKVSLPTDNEMKSYLSGHQVALAKLSAEYCNAMINDTTLRTRIWSAPNYALAKDTAFNNLTVRDELIQKIMDNFWGPAASDEDRPALKEDLIDLIADLQQGEVNNATSTINIVKGVCTAALSSMHVVVK